MKRARILVVQDGASGAAHLEERLRGLGYTVCASVPPAPQAVEEAAGTRPDLALIDLGPEGRVHGLEAAERIGSGFDVPVVLLADGDGESLFQRAWTAPPYSCVPKPFEERQLHWNIQTALSLHERERRHRETENGLERTLAELRERVDLLQSIFDSMKEGVFANDENGKRLLANTSALEVAGLDDPGDISQWAEQYGIFLPDGEAQHVDVVQRERVPSTEYIMAVNLVSFSLLEPSERRLAMEGRLKNLPALLCQQLDYAAFIQLGGVGLPLPT